MKEKTKLILGGFYLIGLTILVCWIFNYLWEKYNNDTTIVLLFALSLLLGTQLSTWSDWATDYNKRKKSRNDG